MKWNLLRLLVAFTAAWSAPLDAADVPARPKLVVVITVDGLPQDQVLKYREQLGTDGLRRFLDRGAWFANAHYGHVTTYTAVGHATILTGAYPYRHGLVGNDWLDRATGARRYCVEDTAHPLLDEPTAAHAGTSPRNLRVTTVGDELRLATGLQSKVLSVSVKDRGAILTGGKLGGAYFYSSATGRFVTSRYYREEYPAWWQEFHADRPQDQWFGKPWAFVQPTTAYACSPADGCGAHVKEQGLGQAFPQPITGGETQPGKKYYSALRWTPFGDEYLAQFAQAAVRGEALGRNAAGVPDLLAISFSCQDYINHLYGPESKPSQDNVLRLDRTLAGFLAFLEEWVGREHLLVAFTADHGFANTPEFCRDTLRLETDRVDTAKMVADVNAALAARFGTGRYATTWWNPTVYLDYAFIDAQKLSRTEVENAAADYLASYPGIHSVYTRSQLREGRLPPTKFGQMTARSWSAQASGDLFLIQQNGWYLFKEPDEHCATHGSPWTYDTHVPLMFLGERWIQPGRYLATVEVVDLAATLAAILSVRPPSGCEGRILGELLRPRAVGPAPICDGNL